MTKGHLSDLECQLRLKRWIVAGFTDQAWDKSIARSFHLSMGGLRLGHFSEGHSAEELERRAERIQHL